MLFQGGGWGKGVRRNTGRGREGDGRSNILTHQRAQPLAASTAFVLEAVLQRCGIVLEARSWPSSPATPRAARGRAHLAHHLTILK